MVEVYCLRLVEGCWLVDAFWKGEGGGGWGSLRCGVHILIDR